jgi:hypothetical protein
VAGTVYSTLFYSGITSDSAPVYEVPDGFVAVLRDVLMNDPSESGTYGVVTGDDGVVAAGGTWPTTETAAFEIIWTGNQVFNAGDHMWASSDSSAATARLSGFLLTTS